MIIMRDFKDKVAVITGAASGIGFGIANKCVQEGMNVVLADKNDESLNRTAKIMKKEGASVIAVKVDVSKASDLEKLAKKTIDTFGVIHMLFNNAGVQLLYKTILDSTLNDWKWIINVNLWGVIHGIKVFVPIMIEQDIEGYIINTSSILGKRARSGFSIYTAGKHGVEGFSRSLYNEVKKYGIKVSILSPAMVNTDWARKAGFDNPTAKGKVIEPEDIALVVQHLIELPDHITIWNVDVMALSQTLNPL